VRSQRAADRAATGAPAARGPRVLVWNEFRAERRDRRVQARYPDGIHAVLADAIRSRCAGSRVTCSTLADPAQGLEDGLLEQTDVLVWWGHEAHDEVSDARAERVRERVLAGMGLVVLHSAHLSKPFRLLMGTSCRLRWRESAEREVVWNVAPAHPVGRGLPAAFVIPEQEMYGEYFDIPSPDDIVFLSGFQGGEVFRSGCCFTRGLGRIFYFGPGHETHQVYYQPEVQQVIANGVAWAHGPGLD
jgi:trehalose utilization protein